MFQKRVVWLLIFVLVSMSVYAAAPTHSTPILNSTYGTNFTTENLTVYNISTADADGDPVKNIINWYKNDESSITVLNMPFENNTADITTKTKDYSSYQNNGTVSGATFSKTDGYDGKGAYLFDGIDDNIIIADTPSLEPPTAITIEFMVNIHSIPTGSDTLIDLISKEGESSERQWLVTKATGEFFLAHLWNSTSSLNDPCMASGTTNVTTEVWYHVVETWDATNLSLYVNGVLENSTMCAGTMAAGNQPVRIGGGAPAGPNYYANATIDEVRIYNVSLTPNQVALLYNNRTDMISTSMLAIGQTWNASITPNDGFQDGITKYSTSLIIRNITAQNTPPTHSTPILNSTYGTNFTTENLTVYNISTADIDGDPVKNIYNWYRNDTSITVLNMPFENNTADVNTTTKDYSGFGNNGSRVGPIYNHTGGFDGKGAYIFDGINDYIDVGNAASLAITGDMTIEAWIYVTDFNNYRGIAAKTVSYKPASFDFYLDKTTGRPVFIRGNGNTYGIVTGTNAPATNTWVHIAATMNGTTVTHYLNGAANGAGTITVTPADSGTNLRIGNRADAETPFNGTIDEVRIYNISLTAEQVLAHYRNKTNTIAGSTLANRTLLRSNDKWNASVTPNDGFSDGTTLFTTALTIRDTASPTHSTPILNSTSGTNTTAENLIVYNISTADADGDHVKNIYNWFRNDTSLTVLNTPFEGGSDSAFTKDYTIFENNGTVNGPVYSATAGFDGKGAYIFDGINDYINVSNDTSLNTELEDEFTVTAWVYPLPKSTQQLEIIGYGGPLVDRNFEVFISHTNNRTALFISNSTNYQYLSNESVTVTFNTWNFIAVRYKKGEDVKLRVNNLTGTGTPSFDLKMSPKNMYIGSLTAGTYNVFNGTIDELMIFNESLTDEQIQLIYENSVNTLHNTMTDVDDVWSASITPNDGLQDGLTKYSNQLTILSVHVNIENMTEWIYVKEVSLVSGNSIIANDLPPLNVAKIIYYLNISGGSDDAALTLNLNNASSNVYSELHIKEGSLATELQRSNFTLLGYNSHSNATPGGVYGDFILSRDTMNNRMRLINNGWGLSNGCCFTALWGSADIPNNTTISEINITASTGINSGKIIVYKNRFFN